MKKNFILIFILFCVSTVTINAQTNNWIDYDQIYFRIPVAKDGVHRITYQTLVNNGFPANQIDPRRIQIFYQGEEQPVYIKGEGSTGIFDPSGYIEFYGQRNRGYRDTVLWNEPQNCINPDFSLYTDTSMYFITYNNSTSNLRYQTVQSQNFDPYLSNQMQYCIRNVRNNYTGHYNGAATRCVYTEGEGFVDAATITLSAAQTKTIHTPNAYAGGPDALIELAVGGSPNLDFVSYIPHHLKVDILGQTRVDEIYYGYEFVRRTVTLPSAVIPAQLSLKFSSNDTQSPNYNDNNKVAYVDITYSHTFNFENEAKFEFYLPSNSDTKDYLEITDFNTNNGVLLYDITSQQRIVPTVEGQTIKALVNAANIDERKLILINNDEINQITQLQSVSSSGYFVNYASSADNVDYLIVTHPKLMSGAQSYKAYRESQGQTVQLLDVEQLYDQFAYGVQKNPGAIRNYIQFIISQTGNVPDYLFLLGKAIVLDEASRNNAALYQKCLVPTFGYPPSDILITAGLGNTLFEPLIPTGRLAANTNQTVLDYLNKVIAYESNTLGEWMKNVMHFGGGANASEQQTFANYLRNFETIIEDTAFGAYVHTFLKNSSDPIQISVSDSVRNLINGGSTIMCFFGHASTSGFDQDIDNPENYENQDRYPFILANSCYSGNIHLQYNESTSEDWILIPDRGAIAFLASVGQGIPSYLNTFTSNLYRSISATNYGESLGTQMQQCIVKSQEGNASDVRLEATCHEMTLHGDPALKLNHADLPDLLIESSDIKFTPEVISTLVDTFELRIQLRNVGMAFADDYLIHIQRTYPDNSIETYDIARDKSVYLDTLILRLPVNSDRGPGLNSLSIQLDYYSEIEELNEGNNNLDVNFLISSGNVYPIYPYHFAVVPSSSVTLKASTASFTAHDQSYVFQVDTTDLFNSNGTEPLYSNTITGNAGVISWDLPFAVAEDRVYFWRVAAVPPYGEDYSWNESSFVYQEGKKGWSQSHYYQLKGNDFQFLEYDRVERDFEFIETAKELHCHNQKELHQLTYEDVFWSIDGAIGDGNGDVGCCYPPPAMILAVIDPITLRGWFSSKEAFGHRNYPKCSTQGRPGSFFVFSTGDSQTFNQTSMDNMIDMIENHIPDGHYLLAYSWVDAYFESWPESYLDLFQSMGAEHIRDMQNGYPYIFFAKKGDASTAVESFSDDPNEEIDLYVPLYTDFNYGTLVSSVIGPARQWNSLHWRQNPVEDPSLDSTYLEILEYNPASLTITPIDTLLTTYPDAYNINEVIPASEHDCLQLRFWTRDDSDKTPAHFQSWQMNYEPVGETAINPDHGFYLSNDTVLRGQNIEFAMATENISPYNMDSLLVKYWLQTSDYQRIDIGTKRLRKHPAGDILMDTVSFSTIDLSGLNSIWIEYNPIVESGHYDQTEQYHFNNIAQYYFYVKSDNENPILDVTFDGIHILDGDIVSAKPEILISLKDENEFIELNDTSNFRLYLTNLNTGLEQRVFFIDTLGNEVLDYTPGSLPENQFKIVYRPVFIEDGEYQLRVQATDESGNESGDNDYLISFEVITKSSITNILNYPNPFSSSTRFVFELTGSVIPDEVRIDIYTVTGKLVKSISQADLGTIRIGRNITDFAWDGTDMYGDQLANGVYFYRVSTRINGEDIEHRSNESDKYFKKEIGKMYLLR